MEIKYLLVRILQKYEIQKPKDFKHKFTNVRGFISTTEMNIRLKERV